MSKRILVLLSLLLSLPAGAAELTLELGSTTRLSTAELLARPDVREVEVQDVAYHAPRRYRAVPLAALLKDVQPGDHLQALATDGFAAELPAAALLAEGPARAWLAIEEPGHPWPALAAGKPGAGPFYLVWTNPEAGHIGPEQWPFQLATLRRLDPVADRFPMLLPAPHASAQVQQGLKLFEKNCLACHRLNGAGDSHLGPDLNQPLSPTEYFADGYLRRYIRDPQSLRHWPEARMPPFTPQILPDAELDALLAYLKHMAEQRRP